MIRGAVEQVKEDTVSGWVFSPAIDLRGAVVLAFVDDVCVGGGKVEVLRSDLADAGLGDGRFGYHFGVTLAVPSDATRLVVKLEGSDALLKQAASRIQGAQAPAAKPLGLLGAPLASLQWMQSQGWLGQSDYDFIRFFGQLGVYDRTLSVSVERPDRIEAELKDPADVVADMMSLIRLGRVEAPRIHISKAGDLPSVLKKHPGATSTVALWSPERARLDVVEGSHISGPSPRSDEPKKQAVEYALGPDRVLFLDLRCIFGRTTVPPPAGLDVFLFIEENVPR